MDARTQLIASFLITAFVTNTVFAEKIIFDSYGRPIKQIQTTQKRPASDISITENSSNKTKETIIPSLEESTNMQNSTDSQLFNTYIEKNQKNLLDFNSNVSKITKLEGTKYFASQNDGIASSADISPNTIKGRVELPWYNGNYIVWNTQMSKNLFFAGEYDQNKNLTGYVVIEVHNNFIRCFEYLFTGDFDIPLKTLSIYYKDENKAGFLYDAKKTLLVYSINGNTITEAKNKIKNLEFLNEIIDIFNNPKGAVKAGKKYSEVSSQIEKRQTPQKAYSYLNYKPDGIKIDLAQAVSRHYGGNGENEPSVIRAYKLARKNHIERTSARILDAPKFPESFYYAYETGVIPKYLKPNYYLCTNTVMLDSMMEIYDLLVKNNFPQKDIKNLIYFYSHSAQNDVHAVSISEIQSIINNPSIAKEDKFYYIYGKLAATHYNNPEIEQDIINSIKLLRQHPQIVQQDFDTTTLQDEILSILNYYPKACKTQNAIQKALSKSGIDDNERYYIVLGELQKQYLIDSDNNYPEMLYTIAETGIMRLGLKSNASKFNETILPDILKTAQILMKNKYWKWTKEENEDLLAICPELQTTSKIVSEVINDRSISLENRETEIIHRLYKEKYKAYNLNAEKQEKVTANGFKAIEKGYYPKYIDEYKLKNHEDELACYIDAIDLMKKKEFNENLIEFLLKNINCNNIVSVLRQNKSDDNLLMDILLLQNKDAQWKEIITEFFTSGLINTNNLDYDIYNALQYRYKEINRKDISELVLLKNTAIFQDEDIYDFISLYMKYLPYLHKINASVLTNSSIKPEDRAAFIFALADIEYTKATSPNACEEYFTAIDEGVNSFWLSTDDGKFNKKILNMYKYMKNDLKYTGEQIAKILNYSTPYAHAKEYYIDDIHYLDRIVRDEYYIDDINYLDRAVRDKNLDYDHKILTLENKLHSIESAKERKEKCNNLARKTLLVITFPLWIIPYGIFYLLFHDIEIKHY